MQLGFIGLGTMGRPMALHLMSGGHAMSVYARRPEATRPLEDEGATVCSSPAKVAERSDVVFTMVTGTSDVEQVVLGADGVGIGVGIGIIHGARTGALVIDMSTIDPTATRRIAQTLADRGVDMLDAPVSGGPRGARDAALTMMVGGPTAVLERARPLFALLGPTVIHLGESGAGQTTNGSLSGMAGLTRPWTAAADADRPRVTRRDVRADLGVCLPRRQSRHGQRAPSERWPWDSRLVRTVFVVTLRACRS